MRDVAVHVASFALVETLEVIPALIRARGNFNRCMFEEAKRAAARPTGEIIADPPIRGSMGPLLLLLTGRGPAAGELTGEGAALLVGSG
ncbi:hypothetical protein ACVBEQ_10700 [Nakamurella sp. GG22]